MSTQAIYGIGVYGDCVYGVTAPPTPKYCYKGIPLGLWVRKQLAHEFIFQVVRGNGYYGSKPGVLYQHRKPYKVPSSIMHPNGDKSRICFADATLFWHGLWPEEKKPYNDYATRHLRMSGYNLFVREYMLSEYAGY